MGFSTDRERWQALCLRTPAAHTSFIYAVITTRILCRPTCSARLARRSNVIFFSTATDAAQAGFRACKRCKPDNTSQPAAEEHQRAIATRACVIIQEVSGNIAPEKVAKQVGLSLRYFHGIFKQITGLTPAGYAKQCRQRLMADTMASSELVTSLAAPLAAPYNLSYPVSISSATAPGLPLDLNEREMAELLSIMAGPNVVAEGTDQFLVDNSLALDDTSNGAFQGSSMAHFNGGWAVLGEGGCVDYIP